MRSAGPASPAGGCRGLGLALFLAACSLAACSAAPSPPEPTGQSAAAIIDGDASPPSQGFVVEIVHPVANIGSFVCSGSLVAPNLVLTARHCIATTSGNAFTCDDSGNGTDGGMIGADYVPNSVYIYAGRVAPNQFTVPSATAVRFFHDDATNVCNHDLALIELNQPITNVPVAPLDLDSPLKAGQTLTAVGWGVLADGGTPAERQQRGGIPVLAVGPADSPNGYAVGPNEFDVGESICVGDSGGPALDAANAIVGVVTRGGNATDAASPDQATTCLGSSTVNFYTETAPFRDVILHAFAAVGSTPLRVAIPMGEACTSSKECTSGLCAAAEADGGTVCTESCASASCPSGFRCNVNGGQSLCITAPTSGCGVATGDTRRDAPWVLLVAGLLVAGLVVLRRRRPQSR